MAFSCGGSPGYFNWDIVAGKQVQRSREQMKRSAAVSFDGADNGNAYIRRSFLDGRRKLTARTHEPPGGEDTAQYRGVSWVEKECKWQARITHKRKTYYLGGFQTKIDAARRYDEYAERLGRPMNFAPRHLRDGRDFMSSAQAPPPLAMSESEAAFGFADWRPSQVPTAAENLPSSPARRVSTSPVNLTTGQGGQDRLLMLAAATASEQRNHEKNIRPPPQSFGT